MTNHSSVPGTVSPGTASPGATTNAPAHTTTAPNPMDRLQALERRVSVHSAIAGIGFALLTGLGGMVGYTFKDLNEGASQIEEKISKQKREMDAVEKRMETARFELDVALKDALGALNGASVSAKNNISHGLNIPSAYVFEGPYKEGWFAKYNIASVDAKDNRVGLVVVHFVCAEKASADPSSKIKSGSVGAAVTWRNGQITRATTDVNRLIWAESSLLFLAHEWENCSVVAWAPKG